MIGNFKGTDLYAVPLTRSSNGIGTTTLNRFVFDVGTVDENDQSLQLDTKKENKTILLVGDNSGKTSLINCIFNYIVGVNWNGPHRFRLKKDGPEGEAESISVYELHHADGNRIPFSLTIVGACVVRPSRNFTEMLDNFLQNGAIEELDLIGLVFPKTIYLAVHATRFCLVLERALKRMFS